MSLPEVQFFSDERGKKCLVLLDLRRHRGIWEDVYDRIVAESRKSEPRLDWEVAKRRLRSNGSVRLGPTNGNAAARYRPDAASA